MALAIRRALRSSPSWCGDQLNHARLFYSQYLLTLGPSRPIRISRRGVEPERKSARSLIQLDRRHAKIEGNTLNCTHTGSCHQGLKTSETTLQQFQTPRIALRQLCTEGDCCRITVNPENFIDSCAQNFLCVAASAKCAVHIDSAIPGLESHYDFLKHNGNMAGQEISSPALAARRLRVAPRSRARSKALTL